MNITRIITVLLLSAALVSCSESTTSLEEGSSRTETVVSEVSTVTNTAITSNNTITALTVKVISYQDGQLIYDHNGKKGNAALDREVLNQHKKYKVISIYERIIAECANEEIKANILNHIICIMITTITILMSLLSSGTKRSIVFFKA